MTESSKYHPLFEHLLYSGQGTLRLFFSEIEAILEARLPPSARAREEWWSNNQNGHSQARAWMRANYRASADLTTETVTFVLNGWPREYRHAAEGVFLRKSGAGLGENPQSGYLNNGDEKPRPNFSDHPLFGIWKGKVSLLADHDYTEPAFDGVGQT